MMLLQMRSAVALTRRVALPARCLLRPAVCRYLTTNDDDLPDVQVIRMPDDLGGGKIVEWYKKEGDIIKYDDVYVDIETHDFAFGMSHDEEDPVTMLEIVAQVDEEVEGGDVLCIVLRSQGQDGKTKQEDSESGQEEKD